MLLFEFTGGLPSGLWFNPYERLSSGRPLALLLFGVFVPESMEINLTLGKRRGLLLPYPCFQNLVCVFPGSSGEMHILIQNIWAGPEPCVSNQPQLVVCAGPTLTLSRI